MFEKNLKLACLLDFYGEVLSERKQSVLSLYYNEDLSLAEIAQHTKITRQGVRDSIKRGEAILLEMEQKLGFYEKYAGVDDKVATIKNLTENIKDINSRHSYSKDIAEFCDDILSELAVFEGNQGE